MATAEKKKQLYMDVAQKASAPLNKREKCAIGRGGVEKEPRRYHLMPEEQVRLMKRIQDDGKFISPYGAGRLYTYIINALVELGAGKPHTVAEVFDKFKELASAAASKNGTGKTLWERFTERPPRNPKTAFEPLAKFMQNVEVLQRLGGKDPYAFKLAQLGACIDVYIEPSRHVKIQLRVNIPRGDPVKPVNTNRKRSYKKTVDQLPSGIMIEN